MRLTLNRGSIAAALIIFNLCAGANAAVLTVRSGWPIVTSGGIDLTGAGGGTALNVNVNDRPLLGPNSPAPVVATQADGSILVTYDASDGALVQTFSPMPSLGASAWAESLTYTNKSAKSQDLLSATMRIAPQLKPGGVVWNPSTLWMGEAGGGQTLHVAYRSNEDVYGLDTTNGILDVNVNSQWRLAPGQSAQVGSLMFWARSGDASDFRVEARKSFEAFGIHVPRPNPDWLATAVLYEANPAGHVESRFSNIGGFDALSHHLDYIHDLGIDAIWYNFVFSYKTPPDGASGGWNPYEPLDYTKIDSILGGPDALHRLLDHGRKLGIHSIAEIVPWGINSPVNTDLKSWWTGPRTGNPDTSHGVGHIDYDSPPWQALMSQACQWLAKDYGVEGIRIDSCEGMGPNWTSPLTNHASFSYMGGQLGMIKAARDGIAAGGGAAGGRVPVILPESSDWPEHFALTPLGYGSEFTGFFEHELPANLADARTIVSRLRDMLERERGSLPEGAMTLRTLNNHDTELANGNVQQRFGAGLSRAFLGLCLASPGVPMLYQEQEIGDYDGLRRMIWARRFLPELGAGEPDYFAATFDPRVFTVVSTLNGSSAIALVNLSGNSVSGSVSLSPTLHTAQGASVYDGVSGHSARIIDGKFAWTMAPYETALMHIGKHPAGQAPSELFAGETYPGASPAPALDLVWRQGTTRMDLDLGGGTWTRSVSGATTTLESPAGRVTLGRTGHGTAVQIDLAAGAPAPRLVVRGADRWIVSGRTAVLSDRVLRRHFPFPAGSNYTWNRKIIWGSGPWGSLYDRVAPGGRLWQSILEPLHPTEPGMQFADRVGAGFTLTGLNTNSGNVVLTDCTDETDVDPYRLETRFYAVDPDLSPVVRTFGLGTQWQVDWASFPPPQSSALHVSFVIEPSKAAEPARFTAPRLPVQRSGMHESDIGPKTKFMFSYATWMPEPGEIHWDGFAAVPGVYRIELELRHSEGSATGTDLDNAYRVVVDGVEQPLTWVKRGTSTFGNSFFGFAQTPPIDLSGKTHSIWIATTRPWAGVREHYRLMKEQK